MSPQRCSARRLTGNLVHVMLRQRASAPVRQCASALMNVTMSLLSKPGAVGLSTPPHLTNAIGERIARER